MDWEKKENLRIECSPPLIYRSNQLSILDRSTGKNGVNHVFPINKHCILKVMVQRFRGSGFKVQRFRGSGFRGWEVQGFWVQGSEVQGFRGSGFRGSGVQGFRVSEVQGLEGSAHGNKSSTLKGKWVLDSYYLSCS